ncbi:MAG TPA: ABC transporter permease [Flavipsychrobacter sp.]|nr:ABC transporter permease [Flavipsychrobacter sp.]
MNSRLIFTSVLQALSELRVNKLRTFLSLLGITIGIFCIIAVLTVLDSMKKNIETEVSTLGNDVLYVGRWPWMDEGGEYKWWEFWRRPSMTVKELRAVERDIPDVAYATLSINDRISVKYEDEEVSNITCYGVTNNFDRLQNIEIFSGRYLSAPEIDGGRNSVVLGYAVYRNLYAGDIDAVGSSVSFLGRKFNVVGVMKLVGQNMAGFDFDNSVIFPYNAAAAGLMDVKSLNYDPTLMIKVAQGKNIDDVKYEVEGALRRERKVRPGQQNDFAINQLSQISERLDLMFKTINMIGAIIGGFSLIVGSFGIANIMFVTVKERTRVIGLKKAIGARRRSIMMEFLVEAITLCILGGLIGILIVLLLSLLLTYGLDFAVTLSLENFFIGVSISATVGVLAGFIPARSASKLDPVVAIRSN